MRPAQPPSADLPPLHRSVAACLATILDLPTENVPAPPHGHPQPWTVWRNWLGQRGMGLVPVLEPAGFSWPGPWIAVLRTRALGPVGAVAFGGPPGIAWDPLGVEEGFEAVESGYVVAPSAVARWTPPRAESPRAEGRVEAIAVAPDREAPMVTVEQAAAHAGRGLEGDRYFDGRGTFSNAHSRGHDLTLIEAETLDELGRDGPPLAPSDPRRNVVTRGIDLNALVGRRFRVGEVECVGRRLCEPCAHLERLTQPGSLRALVHRGGLRADVVSDGVIRVGDAVAAA